MTVVGVKAVEAVGEGATVVWLVNHQGSCRQRVARTFDEVAFFGAVSLFLGFGVSFGRQIMHEAERSSYCGNEMRLRLCRIGFGWGNVVGKEVADRERGKHEELCRSGVRTGKGYLLREPPSRCNESCGSHGYQEKLGAAEDAVGVAVPKSGKERSKCIRSLGAAAGGVNDKHPQTREYEPEAFLPHERDGADDTEGHYQPLHRLVGVKREPQGGPDAFPPG